MKSYIPIPLCLGLAARLILACGVLVTEPGLAAQSPPALAFSTYLGGSSEDSIEGVVIDASGNVYVAGWTWSRNFPATHALGNPSDDVNTFVAKLDPSGGLVFSTLLGGSRADLGVDIALGPGGEIWVLGETTSPDFPRTDGSPGRTDSNVFVTRLAPGGAAILSSTVVGGSGGDFPVSLALDGLGRPIVVGVTWSHDFPMVHALFPHRHDMVDGFVMALESDGSGLEYSTYLGGSALDAIRGVAADAAGHAYVMGFTLSQDFPVAAAWQPHHAGGADAFIVKLSPSGHALVYSTFLGDSAHDQANQIAVGEEGDAWVVGVTSSALFPSVNPFQPALGGMADAFVARLNAAGELVFSSFLGGSGDELGIAIDVGADGVYVAGRTHSADFPIADPVQTDCAPAGSACEGDAFLTRLRPDGGAIVYSTFLGGGIPAKSTEPSIDFATSVGADDHGGAYIAGQALTLDFPVASAQQPEHGGGLRDAFVARIVTNLRPPDCSGAVASPSLIWPPNGKMVPVSILGVTDPEGDPVALKVTGISQDEPGAAFSGIGSSVAQVKAERDGKGDGRVYRIQFEATAPSGASCAGEVRVCVPHDQGKGSCVDSQ